MTGQEINEHKLAQKDLEESRKKYQTLFESASDAILILQKDLKTAFAGAMGGMGGGMGGLPGGL